MSYHITQSTAHEDKGAVFLFPIALLRAKLTRSGKEGKTLPTGLDLKIKPFFHAKKQKGGKTAWRKKSQPSRRK